MTLFLKSNPYLKYSFLLVCLHMTITDVFYVLCILCFMYYEMSVQKERESIMRGTPGVSTNYKDDSARLEAAYARLTPSHFLTSGSGPHESL